MYKCFKKGGLRIAINKFPKTAKNVSSVYLTGFHKWEAFQDANYSIVLGVFRLIVSIDKKQYGEEI